MKMKTTLRLVCILCLAVLVILAVAGCGSSKPSIVGNWQSKDDSNNYIEFTPSGNLVVKIGNQTINGTYQVISDTSVKVNVTGVTGLLAALFSKGTWEYTVTKTDLALIGDRLTRNFTRVK
jgi:hypothetical protein